tara:strand:- start:419 stop:1111 length:693 start_codon:yes stop_codon:yes gene_type:complete
MNDILTPLLKAVDNPIWAAAIILFIALAFIFKDKIFSHITQKSYKRKVRKNPFAIKDLESHDVFNTLYRVKNEVKNSKFYTHGEFDATKTKMCSDFANFKADVCYQGFKDFISDDGLETMAKDKLKIEVTKLQNKLHEKYIEQIKDHWRRKGVQLDDAEYIVELFEKFRYDVLVSFEHRINSIFGTSYHKNNFDLMLAIFEMWAMGIDLLPKDMQTTFESVNGRFKKLDY